MRNLFKANLESTLPTTEATVLNIGNDHEKQDKARKLNAIGMVTITLVMETLHMINMISLESNRDPNRSSGTFNTVLNKIKK